MKKDLRVYKSSIECPMGHYIREGRKILPIKAVDKKFFNRRTRRALRGLLKAALVIMPILLLLTPFPAAAAMGGIDSGAMRIYEGVLKLGKWVIIIRGTIDCIQAVLNGDAQSAKRQFFGYIMCFVIMLGLPWAMNEIEVMFK